MTNKEPKAIYEYMKETGWDYKQYKKEKVNIPDFLSHPLDSNSAWECVQEMERKEDLRIFHEDCYNYWLLYIRPNEDPPDCEFSFWFMNPINFFSYMSKWLSEKEA